MDRRDLPASGWLLVVAAAATMGAAGVYQFAWSSVRLPLGTRMGAPEQSLGTIFTLFVVFQTLGQFPAGWVRDRYGPRVPLLVSAVCLTAGFVGVGVAGSLATAAVAYAVGGIGASASYTVAVNTPVKWFRDRRGLATGVVAMSYGGLSFLVIPWVRGTVSVAFRRTAIVLGVGTGLAALLAAFVIRDPPSDDAEPDPNSDSGDDATGDGDPEPNSDAGAAGASADAANGDADDGVFGDERSWTWRETVRTWQFWLLYVVFAVVNGVGLMVIGKVVSFASQLALPAAAGTAAASLVALADAGGVLVGGAVSDRLGRRHTVAVSLVCSGVALVGAVLAGEAGLPVGFVAAIAVAAFFRSPTFSVFPSLIAEYYGRSFSSENYAALYTSKLFGGVLGGTAASALVVTLGWSRSFLLGATLVAAVGVALAFLRPVTADQAPGGERQPQR
jgi:OFA family oxalate/formate antiporter-like MFS transporter